MRRDATGIVGFCINFRMVRPRKSRVYLTESPSPMSDSHVNDIRYTALWRPVVKARVAPAASPSSPISLVRSVCSFSFSEISPAMTLSRVFLFPPLESTSTISFECTRDDDFVGRVRTRYENDRKFYLLWWREHMLLLRGSPTATATRVAPASIATVRTIVCNALPLIWEYDTAIHWQYSIVSLYIDSCECTTVVCFSKWPIESNFNKCICTYKFKSIDYKTFSMGNI